MRPVKAPITTEGEGRREGGGGGGKQTLGRKSSHTSRCYALCWVLRIEMNKSKSFPSKNSRVVITNQKVCKHLCITRDQVRALHSVDAEQMGRCQLVGIVTLPPRTNTKLGLVDMASFLPLGMSSLVKETRGDTCMERRHSEEL